jgi:phosphate transport system substrate-binding protein
MLKINSFLLLSIILVVTAITGCSDNSKNRKEELDTPTSGTIKITVDETFRPVIESLISTFEKEYKDAKIIVKFKSEPEAVNDLLNDSCRLVIVPRTLTADEKQYFERLQIVPRTDKIFMDGVAIIENPQNRDSLLTLGDLSNILSGKVSNWKDVNGKNSLGKIQIIFDNPRSGNVRYIEDKLQMKVSKNSFAVKSSPDVINYVSKTKNAIGLIGVNWISDKDDSSSLSFLGKIRVVGVRSDNPQATPGEFYQPFQAYIGLRYYPLIREVNVISREARAGLGSGFTAFATHEKGQRIFLKSGLYPARTPVRLVELKEKNLKIEK